MKVGVHEAVVLGDHVEPQVPGQLNDRFHAIET
jgi:hypothetical protein